MGREKDDGRERCGHVYIARRGKKARDNAQKVRDKDKGKNGDNERKKYLARFPERLKHLFPDEFYQIFGDALKRGGDQLHPSTHGEEKNKNKGNGKKHHNDAIGDGRINTEYIKLKDLCLFKML